MRIAGGIAGLRVSWQVTGIRHDAYAEHNRIPVEMDKPAPAQGKDRSPEARGLSPKLGILVPATVQMPAADPPSHSNTAPVSGHPLHRTEK